eukprot:m.68177 g.68177  ORF g.68177 m.68177 type:complete len:379 (+) comp9905_c0_seq2:190-1326(+)
MAGWACEACTFVNQPLHLACGICLTPRAPNAAPSPNAARPGTSSPSATPVNPSPAPVVALAGDAGRSGRKRKRKSSDSTTPSLAGFLTKGAKRPVPPPASKRPVSSGMRPASVAIEGAAIARGSTTESHGGRPRPTMAAPGGRGDDCCVIDGSLRETAQRVRGLPTSPAVEHAVPLARAVESGVVRQVPPEGTDFALWIGGVQCPAPGCSAPIGSTGFFCCHDRCGVTVCPGCSVREACPACGNPVSFCRNLSLEKWAAAVTKAFGPKPTRESDTPIGATAGQSGCAPGVNSQPVISQPNGPPPSLPAEGPATTSRKRRIHVTETLPTNETVLLASQDERFTEGAQGTPNAQPVVVASGSASGSDFFEDSDPEPAPVL